MDQNTYPSFNQEKTVCERLIRAIQTTSPFRTILFTKQNRGNADASTIKSPNVPLMTSTSVKDCCARISQQPVALTPGPGDHCSRILKQSDSKHELGAVPIIFDLQDGSTSKSHERVTVSDQPSLPVSSLNINQAKPKTAASVAQGKATVLPIHGSENSLPTMPYVMEKSSLAEIVDGMCTEYIDRTGRKIRCPTNVSVRNASMRTDSFNDKVSDFIYRAKHKFQTVPSSIDASPREFKGKEKRFK